MALTIAAHFPLGTYLGADSAGEPEAFPTPARLHAAFLNAAARGTRAVNDGGQLQPSDGDLRALQWLEQHPPTGLAPPLFVLVPDSITVYRREGLLEKGRYKNPRAAQVRRSAIGSSTRWVWNENVPREVVAALRELAVDIGYLGGADSPVVVEVLPEVPDGHADILNRQPDADPFAPVQGLEQACADHGRTAYLQQTYRALHDQPPKGNQVQSEVSIAPPRAVERLRTERYCAVAPEPTPTPWPLCQVLPVKFADARRSAPLPEVRRVAGCVQLHRAVVSLMDRGGAVPPVVTGVYEPGVTRPANRLALHYVTADHPLAWDLGDATGAFVVLGPQSCSTVEWSSVTAALQALHGYGLLRTRFGAFRVMGHRSMVTSGFWSARPPRTRRLWVPAPLAVAETRVPRSRPTRRTWGFEQAAALSIGLVWRDRFGFSGRGDERYWRLADHVLSAGVAVRRARRVTGPDLSRYVHRTNDGAAVDAYTALIELPPGLGDDRSPVAIGQSRHLGGGLLVPVDLPEAVADQVLADD